MILTLRLARVMQELLNQVSHYNERVRKDALTGLQQLFQEHPGEIRKQVLIWGPCACSSHECGLHPKLSNACMHQTSHMVAGRS